MTSNQGGNITTHSIHQSSERVGRFNAWFFDTFDGFINWSTRRMKKQVYSNLPDTIVEIGPGVGSNFGYYRTGTTVVAVEPNFAMHQRLRSNAESAGINLVLKTTTAEATGLEDQSAQAVVSNLVLCTVVDPTTAVREARRILKPGGRLLLVEHVRGRGPMLRTLQRLMAGPWKWLFEGCELGRDTLRELVEAGFDISGVLEKTVPTVFLPINAFVFGEAIK